MNLKEKLKKSREALSRKLGIAFGKGVDEDTLEIAEEILLASDLGWELTEIVLKRFREEFKLNSESDWKRILVAVLEEFLPVHKPWTPDSKPAVTLVVGVNGAGKTTTIARLSQTIKAAGESVLMGCADTYRAAASEQLALWGQRLNIPVHTSLEGADPAAVTFDAIRKAQADNLDHVIIDTAGRLHTQKGLMDELSKVYRVAGKAMEGAPHRVLLVLDGTVGQNALPQAQQFMKFLPVTDLVVTKLDGTAKGGSVFAMARELNLPIRYIGVGEGAEDLIEFNGRTFIEAIVGGND
ncbi:MAG: signal recognition particle-docking protein FtsY [Candidatus Sabulitectum sp.]|nr:signal recognition particle-docking protein FtsY [Candidatus Sabulitectum sp.]